MLKVEDLRDSGAIPVFPRAVLDLDEERDSVRGLIQEVRDKGDDALFDIQERFGARPATLRVPKDERDRALADLPADLRESLEIAAARIRAFHERQMAEQPEGTWRTGEPGATVGERHAALSRAGCYVPGGRASYPSSVLMTAIPARIAGVSEVVVCCPPGSDGRIAQAALAACAIAGVDEVFAVGGAQAIAAMAYGTNAILPVDVIVGPGNIYVTLAKMEVAHRVRVDGFQGPTEIAIIADSTAPAGFIAADLVAQAEHDPLATCLLITDDESLVDPVIAATEAEVERHPRRDEVAQALRERGCIYLVRSMDDAVRVADAFAPEHLELIVASPERLSERIRNAGAIFSGPYSPVSLGDYMAGTNHVLPTAGSGRYTSALGVSTFRRSTGLISFGAAGLERLTPALVRLAEAEGLVAHARAVQVRAEDRGR